MSIPKHRKRNVYYKPLIGLGILCNLKSYLCHVKVLRCYSSSLCDSLDWSCAGLVFHPDISSLPSCSSRFASCSSAQYASSLAEVCKRGPAGVTSILSMGIASKRHFPLPYYVVSPMPSSVATSFVVHTADNMSSTGSVALYLSIH